MSTWLLPVSRHVRFAQPSGHTVASAFGKLQEAALNNRLSKVECEVRGPLVDVTSGDEI